MKIAGNFTQAMDFVKPGIYRGAIVAMDSHISKQNTQCVRVKTKIVEGEFKGRFVSTILPIEGKAAGFWRKFLQVFKPDYFDGPVDTEELIDKPVIVEILESKSTDGLRSYSKNFFRVADEETILAVNRFLDEARGGAA